MEKPNSILRGFTLIELMVVIFIVSILAAVAIPLVNKYLKRSKNTEAALNLRKIYDGEISYFQEEHLNQTGGIISKQFVSTTVSPAYPPNRDKRQGSFESGGWPAIKFSPDGPVLYCYSVTSTGTNTLSAFTARAEGDLDEDGTTSLFERVGSVDAVSGEVVGGAAIYELDPLE